MKWTLAFAALVFGVTVASTANADDYLGGDFRPPSRRASELPPVQGPPSAAAANARAAVDSLRRAQDGADRDEKEIADDFADFAAPLLAAPDAATYLRGKLASQASLLSNESTAPVPYSSLPTGGAPDEESKRFLAAATRLAARGLIPDDVRRAPSGVQARAQLARIQATFRTQRSQRAEASASANASATAAESSAGMVPVVAARPRFSIDDIKRLGFSLRRTFDQEGSSEGARATYVHDFDESDDAISAEFCLKWKKTLATPGSFVYSSKFYASYEANITTGEETEKHFWGMHAGFAFLLDFDRSSYDADGPIFDRHAKFVQASVDAFYLRRTDGNQEQAVAQLLIKPRFGDIALGVRRGHESIPPGCAPLDARNCCCEPTNLVSWQWDLDLEARGGNNIKHTDGLEQESTILRTYVELAGMVYFDGLGRRFGADPWDSQAFPYIRLAYQAWGFPLESSGWRDAIDLTLRFPLSEIAAIEANYHNGASEPDYSDVEQLTISLTARF